ncbi:hypothetical protein [Natrinema pallidum]|uniref:Uncharacterized protein n=1 Tax=Natrinema pallidum TaxID=69527 RepID=A0A4P9TM15_9EURY|nr:hypothetical protein [Natrinema pallidum]QCW05265.1 hypothetical protein FGF80_18645 [Natrinema pallidum]
MVETPADKIDIEDYDSIDSYIDDALEAGWTLEAEDFEGRPCAYCGDLIDYADVMGDPEFDVPTYDIRVTDPDADGPEPYIDRHYFCSADCRDTARRSTEWHLTGQTEHVEPDRIHIDDVEGMI